MMMMMMMMMMMYLYSTIKSRDTEAPHCLSGSFTTPCPLACPSGVNLPNFYNVPVDTDVSELTQKGSKSIASGVCWWLKKG